MRDIQDYRFRGSVSPQREQTIVLALRKAGFTASLQVDSHWVWLRTDASLTAIALTIGECLDLSGPFKTIRF